MQRTGQSIRSEQNMATVIYRQTCPNITLVQYDLKCLQVMDIANIQANTSHIAAANCTSLSIGNTLL